MCDRLTAKEVERNKIMMRQKNCQDATRTRCVKANRQDIARCVKANEQDATRCVKANEQDATRCVEANEQDATRTRCAKANEQDTTCDFLSKRIPK